MNRKKLQYIDFDGQNEEAPQNEEPEEEEEASEDSSFAFSKTIKNLLYVYGDQRKSEANQLAHLILQELIGILFDTKHVRALIMGPLDPWVTEEPPLVFPQSNSKIKNSLQNYLYHVFSEFVAPFQRLSKNLKVVQIEDSEQDMYLKALIKKSKEENVQMRQEVEGHSQSESVGEPQQPESPQPEWENYMTNRIKKMSHKEFIKFMDLRSKTFINHKQFKKLVDPFNFGSNFYDNLNCKFLNYCLCRILKKIIQKAMKESKDLTNFKLDEESFKKIGYSVASIYMIRAKKYALQDEKFTQMAFKIFEKEFPEYEQFLQTFLNLEKNHDTRYYWGKLGKLKAQFLDRVKGEKQLRQVLLKRKQIKPSNQYATFLLNKAQGMTYEEAKPLFSKWFKNWFVNNRVILPPISSIYD